MISFLNRKATATISPSLFAIPACLLFLVGGLDITFAAPAPIDLAGQWKFAPDEVDAGISATPEQWVFPEKIQLPGQVAAQGFGEIPTSRTQWAELGWRYPDLFKEWRADDNFKMPFSLQPRRRYVGPAWYQREVEIPAEWNGKHALLHLERVHWQTTAWVNGKEIGKCNSLGTPHEFDLGSLPSGKHTLTLRIDNRIVDVNPGIFAHSVTDATQGNWNGVVGKMELQPVAPLHIHEARVEPSFAGKSVNLVVTANRSGPGKITGKVRYLGPLRDFHESAPISVELADGKAMLSIPMDLDPRPWNEFSPHLYQAEIAMESASGRDVRTETFGFRDLGKAGGRLAINGKPIYLRGTLECCIFPLTGYPPTEVEPWRRIIRICKEHGLNHMRFHSWCPPKAAFIAADEAGFYLQVEASAWASFGAEIGSGMPLDPWIDEETTRMIRAYGNHPSFLMMAYGNEPAGPNSGKWLQDYVARWKENDKRRFWTTAAGWPRMPGSDFHNLVEPRIQGLGLGMNAVINAQPPRTDFDWTDYVNTHPDAPIISHEIGQWCAYPNFEEIPKYTGFFKPKNFEIFRETATRNGLMPQAKDFLMASGKLQALCYKHDIEAALRTPGFGGYQLLDLHDFPGQGTALVGVLDAFWDSKGYITPQEYARSAGPVVPLAKLKKMTWQTNETLEAELQLSHFGPEDYETLVPIWKLSEGDKVLVSGKLPARKVAAGDLHDLGAIRIPLEEVQAPSQLQLTVSAAGETFSNDWDIFVYPPEVSTQAEADVTITDELADALDALEAGKTVIWTPPSAAVKNDPNFPFTPGFPPIFWNAAWGGCQPPHTLGILCNPNHPALAEFPTDFHSNWQWWELQKDARPFILTQHLELIPIVQIIDDWQTNRKLGYVFDAKVGKGKLLACSFDISSNLDTRMVARQMRASLLSYLGSGKFEPKLSISAADLEGLAPAIPTLRKLGAQITASSEEEGFPTKNLLDGIGETIWHTEYLKRQPSPPHQLTITLPEESSIRAVLLTQRRDGEASGQIAEIEILDGDGKSLARSDVPKDATSFRVALPPFTQLKSFVIRVHKTHTGPFGSIADLDVERES